MNILNTSVNNNKNKALTNMKDTGWTKRIVAFNLYVKFCFKVFLKTYLILTYRG
jgi:hypothetical protein